MTTTTDEFTVDGNCSLREAISAANTDAVVDGCPAGSGADTIVVPAGTYALSIPGAGENANASGDLDITSNLTVGGAGEAATIIDGASLDRVFHVDPTLASVTAEISGVTIQHGLAQDGFATFGGGILNGGTLTLNKSIVRSNTGVTLDVFGGGIANLGTLTLNDSTVSENGSPGQAVSGGGIGNFTGATATLNRSTVSGNSTGSFAGGIRNLGTLTIANSTVSGNNGFFAGGIQNGVDDTMTVNNSTVTGNQAAFGGGILNNGLLALKNTIIGKNTGGDCAGAPTSLGHNLDSDGSCALTGTGDISGVDPRLGPLADNGGLTKTHELLSGSTAIDAGSGDCPPPLTDQRGVTRPQGPRCDIGAFEQVPKDVFYLHGSGATANPPTLTLDTTAPSAPTAKYKDSTSISFSGGNPWKEGGTWTTTPASSTRTLNALSDLHAFLGLKNSDDQGTQFDLRAQLFKNGVLVGTSTTPCITGVTRNPDLAKEITATFGPVAGTPVAPGDVLSLKLSTRIGTNPNGSKCVGPGGSHSNAVGLRVYFDAANRPARFSATFAP